MLAHFLLVTDDDIHDTSHAYSRIAFGERKNEKKNTHTHTLAYEMKISPTIPMELLLFQLDF